MEVLEHCLEDGAAAGDRRAGAAVRRRRLVVISVPIEIGPSLAGKQLVRALAGLRGLGDYGHRERYSPLELLRALLGLGDRARGRSKAAARRAVSLLRPQGVRLARRRRASSTARFTIARRLFTPMPCAGPFLNSQAWFVCRRDDAGAPASRRGDRAAG